MGRQVVYSDSLSVMMLPPVLTRVIVYSGNPVQVSLRQPGDAAPEQPVAQAALFARRQGLDPARHARIRRRLVPGLAVHPEHGAREVNHGLHGHTRRPLPEHRHVLLRCAVLVHRQQHGARATA